MYSVVGPSLLHGSQGNQIRPVFVQNPYIVQEGLDGVQITTEQITGAIRSDHRSDTFRQNEGVLNVHNLTNVVQNFEDVDKLGVWLGVEDSWEYIRVELVFNAEISLQVRVKEGGELVLKGFTCSRFGKTKVFVVGKLAEILAQNVLKIVQNDR